MPKKIKWLFFSTMLFMVGSSLLWPLNAIFMTTVLEKSMLTTGYVLMAYQGCNLLGNLLGGRFFDRFGGMRTSVFGVGIGIMALAALLVENGWPFYPIFLCIIGFGSGLLFPVVSALGVILWPEGGRKLFNGIYVANNLGIAFGSGLSGVLADFSFRWVYAGNILFFLLFFLIYLVQFKSYRNMSSKKMSETVLVSRPSSRELTFFWLLNLGFTICWLAFTQWQATLPPYATEIGISLTEFSLLWSVNGILIVIGQPVLSYVIKHWFQTYRRQMLMGILFFLLGYLCMPSAESFADFLFAMILFTFAEMFAWPVVPAVANDIAPKGQIGKYQGIASGVSACGRMLGPVIGSGIVAASHIHMMYQIMTICIVFAFFIVWLAFWIRNRKNEIKPF